MKSARSDGDELELVERARKGDREAFGILVERYQRRVVGVVLSVVRNPEDAVELAQETFVRAYQNLSKFEERSSFSTWLYRIAVNLAIDWRRRENRRVTVRGEEAEVEIERMPTTVGDAFKETARGETAQRIRKALDELTPELRTVILLREVEGLSYEEIAEVLGCPRGTVMSRLFYARSRLRELLKDLLAQ